MSHEYELQARRIERLSDNTECKPVDLLKALVRDIETGRVEFESVLVLTGFRPDDSRPWEFNTFRAGVTREQEIALCEMAKERCIRDWLEDGHAYEPE